MAPMADMSVGGDHDSWIVYDRPSADGNALVVRARIGNPAIVDFELQHLVTGVRCMPDDRFIDDGGMPQVVDSLYDIEDRLIAELSSRGVRAYHTASVTGEGQRIIYF